MFVTAAEMYAREKALFASGVSAESLMNEAGAKIAREILHRFQNQAKGLAIAAIGKGNNGADALVVLRHLKEAGWQIAVRSAFPPDSLEGLPAKKLSELDKVPIIPSLGSLNISSPVLILDGLLGIGTTGNLRAPLAGLAREINKLSDTSDAFVISIDVPSGLNCDTGDCSPDTIKADLTCTLGSPKTGLVADQAINHVGALSLLSLSGLSDFDLTKDHLISPATLPIASLNRPFDFHKGQAGRVGIIAGSRGLAGAAALTSLGALHGGGGLITLFVKEADYPLILPLVPVEVMVRPVKSYREVLAENLDALAIGPGLGHAGTDALAVIREFQKPTVIDADALNLIARRSSLDALRPNHLVTPHPGEMARLFTPETNNPTRAQIAREFTKNGPATLLYKGARTIITAPDQALAYNTTGTPAMATGGQGDVLSGLLAALLARGLPLFESAKLGTWLTGKASEIALCHESPESLSATTTARHLGPAFQSLRQAIT